MPLIKKKLKELKEMSNQKFHLLSYHNKDQLALSICKDSNNVTNKQNVALKDVAGCCDGGPAGVVGGSYLDVSAQSKNDPPVQAYNENNLYGTPRPDPLVKDVEIPGDLRGDPPPEVFYKCNKGYMNGECENGHRFSKLLICRKEFCGNCGKKWSVAHQRRYYDWLGKLNRFKTVGYLVFTFPEQTWELFKDREKLLEIKKYVYEFLVRQGYPLGLARWHWFGDCDVCKGRGCKSCHHTGAGRVWKPHLNLLFEAGWIEKDELNKWRELFTARLERMFDQSFDTCVINYQFTDRPGKAHHWLRYVTRATWRFYDLEMDKLLFRFRYGTSWGNWKGKGKETDVSKLERGFCPICRDGSEILWNVGWSSKLEKGDRTYLKAGFWVWNKQVIKKE